ncbi:MAG: ABC transporter permease [Bacteroidales bacterium]
MLFSYLKIAWRILLRNKAYTTINIVGLGLGFSVSLMLMVFVAHQLSYDRFHDQSEHIYRLTIDGSMADGQRLSAPLTAGPVAELLDEQVPEVQQVVRVFPRPGQEIHVDMVRFGTETVVWTDPDFFQLFTFPLIAGVPDSSLDDPFSVVLSVSAAEKFFGTTDVVDRTISISGQEYRITGVMENMPLNSHFQYDIIASLSSQIRPEYNIIEDQGLSFPTYLKFGPANDPANFAPKVLTVADDFVNELYGPMGLNMSHDLQPLEKVYLHSRFTISTMGETGDIRNVYVFSFLTLFVLLIAVFNFINLMTAQSEKRAREIGLRKVIGACKPDLIRQFVGEAVIVSLFAFVFALLLNELFIGSFSQMLGNEFPLLYWKEPLALLGIILFVIVVGVLAGMYPAFYLSRYQPAAVLKGEYGGRGKPHSLRKVLVGLQFAISIFLIACLLLVQQQVTHMKYRELGFDREHVLTVRSLTGTLRNGYDGIKAELLQHPGILKVTASQSVPGQSRSVQNAFRKGQDPSTAIMIHENRIQHDYLETFGLQIVEGRDFDPEMRTDTASFVINQKAVRELGLDEPIGAEINVWQQPGKVIGVVADFNFRSLHHEIDPLAFTMYSSNHHQISVRFRSSQLDEVMNHVRSVLETADPNYVFDYFFVDEMFEEMYNQEERISSLITLAAILAIVISFMGLYALTSFTVAQKVKEIGIRKTFGAPVSGIVAGLMAELSRWLVLGALIAIPVSWWVVGQWLQNFAFRIDLVELWWVFALAVLLAGIIGSMAMLYQALNAARANPIDSLRTE